MEGAYLNYQVQANYPKNRSASSSAESVESTSGSKTYFTKSVSKATSRFLLWNNEEEHTGTHRSSSYRASPSKAPTVCKTNSSSSKDSPLMSQHQQQPCLSQNSSPQNKISNQDSFFSSHIMKRSNHNNRRTPRRGEEDDVSEVTVDTTLRESYRQQDNHWAEQMALLKLDLANTKAECDRSQWRHGQLLEKKQHADEKIGVLEKENAELKGALREVEKKFLILSMHGTTASSSGSNSPSNSTYHNCQQQQQQQQNDSNSDLHSLTGGSNHSHSIQPYRTIHEDDEEDDDDDNDCVSLGWRHCKRDDDPHDGGSVISNSPHHYTTTRQQQQHRNSLILSTPFVDMTSMQLGDDPHFSTRSNRTETMMEEMQDISIRDIKMSNDSERKDDTVTLNTATSTKYPDNDPFATMNPREADGEESVDGSAITAASWWGGWGGRKKTVQ